MLIQYLNATVASCGWAVPTELRVAEMDFTVWSTPPSTYAASVKLPTKNRRQQSSKTENVKTQLYV